MGYGRKWRAHKGHIIYDIERGKLVLQELVEHAGAELLVQAWTAGAIVEDGAVRGVIVESKSGREAIRAKVVVDATGDADIAAFAGVPLHTAAKGIHSICFRLGNVGVDAFVHFFRQKPGQFPEYMDVEWSLAEALAQYDDCGTFLFPHGGGMQMDAFKRAKASGELPATIGIQDTTDACQMHALRLTGVVHVITGFTHFDGLLMGAGRSISTDNPSLLRVMVHTMVVGQAAGTAAAVAVKTGVTPREVNLTEVQSALRKQGVSLSTEIDGRKEAQKAQEQERTRTEQMTDLHFYRCLWHLVGFAPYCG